jgi:hypothetical protein
MKGLFCANFASSRECWEPCKQVWCGKCYTPHPLDRFHRYSPTDEDGYEWQSPDQDDVSVRARNGDHLVVPFQCDLCIFRNLTCRNPFPQEPQDALLLCCIRRVNLDAVWGRESATVMATLRSATQMVKLWETAGLPPLLPSRGPFPVVDSFGYGVAIAMVLKSLEPGKYNNFQQFETIRKLRAGYSNIYMSSVSGSGSLRTMGGERAKYFLTDNPTQSLWFERFCRGCLRRMGQEVRQDWAIPLECLHALLTRLEAEWNSRIWEAQVEAAELGAFAVIAFCGSFRGPEVFMVDLHGLRKYLLATGDVPEDCVIIPLLGKFKGETGERYHLTPLASETTSGLKVKQWVKRLVYVRERQGKVQGPAFCTATGGVAKTKPYELGLMERLVGVQEAQPRLFPGDVDVYEQFGVSRSFRRGATSAARARGVSDRQVDLINRWRTFESSKGRRPQLSMHDHYSDIRILIPELVQFSKAL